MTEVVNVCIGEDLLKEADIFAARYSMSRSELFRRALEEFLKPMPIR